MDDGSSGREYTRGDQADRLTRDSGYRFTSSGSSMSQELIYTSVPRGLKPGAKGFCTVAMSANMPGALVERLESLSGYRPVFPLGDPSAARNPVNWSHWRLT